MTPVSDSRADELGTAVREFLRRMAARPSMQRKDPDLRAQSLQADAFNYIVGFARSKSVTKADLVQALAVADDEIKKLTGGEPS